MTTMDTPFHAGELAIQERLGVREKVHKYAPKMIRSYMPDQHRAFFSDLPHLFLGAVDAEGYPWASVVWGQPGFMSSPTPQHLRVEAMPGLSDPVFASLPVGAEIGAVGMMFHNRRRNRVNGRVAHLDETGFDLAVTQSFGNCPQYIQARELGMPSIGAGASAPAEAAERRQGLTEADHDLITKADTLFIATVSAGLGDDQRRGADMSHRGGAPGFVKKLEDGALLIPDFSGNRHFSTLGNILETGRAGLLFIDFARGSLLHLSGAAEIVWPDATPYRYDGAERYLKFRADHVIFRPDAMPFDWTFLGASPRLPKNALWRPLASVTGEA